MLQKNWIEPSSKRRDLTSAGNQKARSQRGRHPQEWVANVIDWSLYSKPYGSIDKRCTFPKTHWKKVKKTWATLGAQCSLFCTNTHEPGGRISRPDRKCRWSSSLRGKSRSEPRHRPHFPTAAAAASDASWLIISEAERRAPVQAEFSGSVKSTVRRNSISFSSQSGTIMQIRQISGCYMRQ